MKNRGNISAIWSECLQMASEGSLSGIRKRFIALISAFHKVGNRRVFSEKWNGEGGLTASKQPVSSNVKLIYPLIKWKTIEMSVHVIQQRAIEILRRDREEDLFWQNPQCLQRYFLDISKWKQLQKRYFKDKSNRHFYRLQCLIFHLRLSVVIILHVLVSEFCLFDTLD